MKAYQEDPLPFHDDGFSLGQGLLEDDGFFVGEVYRMQGGRWVRPNGMDWELTLYDTVTHWMPISIVPIPVRKDEEELR